MLLGEANYEYIKFFLQSFFGKFLIVGIIWSFTFQILSEIRHLVWDFGYGFEIKTANFSGRLVIISSLALTIIFWLFARGFI